MRRWLTTTMVAAGVAGVWLAAADMFWIASRFPLAVEPIGGVARCLWPVSLRGLVAGAVLGALLGIGVALARRGARWGAARSGRRDEQRWLALMGAVVVVTVYALLAIVLLRGRHARAAVGHPVLLVVVAAAVGWAGYQVTRLAGGALTGRIPRIARLVFTGACAAVAAACFLADHLVLVRLYEPFHVALRAGAFVALLVALLVGASFASPAARRVARWSLAGSVAVLIAVLSAVEGSGPARAQAVAAVNVVRLHGGAGATMVAIADVVTGRAGARPAGATPATGGGVRDRMHRPTEVLAPGANILLITVDALRADHLEPYGYWRATSPHLSRLAQDSVVFERAYTSAPHTSFAITSLLTGYPAMSLANRGLLDGTPTLAELARANGYRTAAFYPPAVFFVDGERLKAFEDHAFGFEFTMADNLDETSSAEIQTERVLSFLTDRSPERFLSWVHYFAPHEPYVAHPGDGPEFGKRSVDRYDGEIRWVDRQIGRLVSRVRTAYPNTIVVVTADHGEEFGEHGGAYHGTTLFDEQVRVPLIVSVPGFGAARIRAPVSTTDVVPTVLGATGMRAGAKFDGTDLTPWLDPRGAVPERELPPVFAENANMRMAAWGDDKLVCDTRHDRCALYDMSRDSVELVDTSSSRPERVSELREQMHTWIARQDGLRGRPDVWSEFGDRGAAPATRRAAARAIARAPEAARLPQLRSAWQGEQDAAVGAWLAVALAELGDRAARAAIPALVDRAEAADDELRAHAALARARFAAIPPVAELAAALPRVSEVNLRCALMHALAQAGTPLGASTLIREYEPVRSRICCAEALATLHEPSTLSFILERLADEPYTIVQAALVRALGRIGDRRAVAALRSLRASTPEADLARAIDGVLADMDS